MRNFKFLSSVDDEDAVEPNLDRFRELVDYQRRTEMVFVPSETTQIYTEMLRMNVPINEMTETDLNLFKISQERVILERISNTLDFRHEIIHQDENGFTLRTELYL